MIWTWGEFETWSKEVTRAELEEHPGYMVQEKSPVFQQVDTDRDRLCGLVVRVSGYRYRGLGFDSRRYQIF